MAEFPAHFIRPEPVPQPRLPVPPVGEHEWRAGAVALLAVMTPAGQRRALREWAKLDPPFQPPLPRSVPPPPTSYPARPAMAVTTTLFAEPELWPAPPA